MKNFTNHMTSFFSAILWEVQIGCALCIDYHESTYDALWFCSHPPANNSGHLWPHVHTLIKIVTISELAYTVTRYQDLRLVQRLQPIYVHNARVAYKEELLFEHYLLGNALLNLFPVLVQSNLHFIPGHTLWLRVKSLYTTTGRNL